MPTLQITQTEKVEDNELPSCFQCVYCGKLDCLNAGTHAIGGSALCCSDCITTIVDLKSTASTIKATKGKQCQSTRRARSERTTGNDVATEAPAQHISQIQHQQNRFKKQKRGTTRNFHPASQYQYQHRSIPTEVYSSEHQQNQHLNQVSTHPQPSQPVKPFSTHLGFSMRSSVAQQGYAMNRPVAQQGYAMNPSVAQQGHAMNPSVAQQSYYINPSIAHHQQNQHLSQVNTHPQPSQPLNTFSAHLGFPMRSSVAQQGHAMNPPVAQQGHTMIPPMTQQGHVMNPPVVQQGYYINPPLAQHQQNQHLSQVNTHPQPSQPVNTLSSHLGFHMRPAVDMNRSTEEVRLVEKKFTRKSFADRFNELLNYKDKFGDVDVPQKSPEYRSLGQWCNQIRFAYRSLSDDKKRSGCYHLTKANISALESIGFKWSLYKRHKTFDEHFKELNDFHEKFGHCNVSTSCKVYGSLGRWCNNIRQSFRPGMDDENDEKRRPNRLTVENIERLNSIGFKWANRRQRKNESASEQQLFANSEMIAINGRE